MNPGESDAMIVELNEKPKNEEIIEVATPDSSDCCTTISAKLNDQDFMQKVNVYTSFIFELYRVVMGSFLILFVPQKCGDGVCTTFENIGNSDSHYDAAFGMNIATFVMFLCMYFAEITRENKMITDLHVNVELPNDDEAVAEALEKLPEEHKVGLLTWDKRYLRSGQVALLFFICNAGLSSTVISNNYLDNKTLTALITNILFMALKVNETYSITNTSTNVFYSAYLSKRLQFNDADPDMIIKPDESNDKSNDKPVDTDTVDVSVTDVYPDNV